MLHVTILVDMIQEFITGLQYCHNAKPRGHWPHHTVSGILQAYPHLQMSVVEMFSLPKQVEMSMA